MKKTLWVFMAVVFCGALSGTTALFAADSSSSAGTELAADKAKIQAEKAKIKTDAQTAKSEEAALRSQLKAAKLAGDKEKVKTLRAQLKAMHHANVLAKQTDTKDLNAAQNELRQDRRSAVRSR